MADFGTTALIIFLAVLYGQSAAMGALPMVLLRFPSTVLHELAHLAVSLVTFAHPDSIDILPKRVPGGWVLGSVKCERITMFNAFPVGMAPLLINLPMAWWAFQEQTLKGYILTFLLLTSAVPSEQDIKVAMSSLIGGIGWILFLCSVFQLIIDVSIYDSLLLSTIS